MWPNPQFPADLVTFTEETLNGKLHFLCSDLFTVYIKDTAIEAYLELSQTNTKDFFAKTVKGLQALNYFHKKAPFQIFDMVVNTPLKLQR